MTTGASYLRRGYRFDPECHRMTYRLEKARAILRAQGIEPTYGEPRWYGDDENVSWPAWVTDSVFEAAFALADAIQTEKGSWHRRAADRVKAAS